MRSATIKISVELLFNLIGLKNLDSWAVDSKIISNGDCIEIKLLGNDDRLPDGEDYKECLVVAQTFQSHFEPVTE